jgi:uncharacterized protein RhaS with RHS repeats
VYDPLVGRFLEDDPLEFEAGDTNLQRYVHNSPTNATDPSGLADVSDAKIPATLPLPNKLYFP